MLFSNLGVLARISFGENSIPKSKPESMSPNPSLSEGVLIPSAVSVLLGEERMGSKKDVPLRDSLRASDQINH